MHHSTGPTLIGIGGLHTVVGVVGYRPQLAAIARDGVVDAVDPYADRQTAFWFALTGVTLMLWGDNIRWMERTTGSVPPALPWQLLGVGSVGVVLMPRSGFWLLLGAALLAWRGRGAAVRRARERSPELAAPPV